MAEQEQIGHRREVAADRDHGQSSCQTEVEKHEADDDRCQRQGGLAGLDAVVRDHSALAEQHALEEEGRKGSGEAQERHGQGNPPEPLERAREDHLDQGAGQGEECSQAEGQPQGVRHDLSDPARLSRREVRVGRGQAEAPDLGQEERQAVRDEKGAGGGGAELARDDCDRREPQSKDRDLSRQCEKDVRPQAGRRRRNISLGLHAAHRRRAV